MGVLGIESGLVGVSVVCVWKWGGERKKERGACVRRSGVMMTSNDRASELGPGPDQTARRDAKSRPATRLKQRASWGFGVCICALLLAPQSAHLPLLYVCATEEVRWFARVISSVVGVRQFRAKTAASIGSTAVQHQASDATILYPPYPMLYS